MAKKITDMSREEAAKYIADGKASEAEKSDANFEWGNPGTVSYTDQGQADAILKNK